MFGLGVVAHIDREQMAEDLKAEIDADFMSVDLGHLGAGTNHRIVWSVLSDLDSEWSVVLEEDAVPVVDFRSQLDEVLTAAPTDIVSLYLGRLRPPQYQDKIGDALAKAQANDAHFIVSNHCLHAVALAVRTNLVPYMLAGMKPYLPVDQAIGRWCRQRGHHIAYSVPSICDHRDLPSLIDHPDGRQRVPGRVAWQWGQRTAWFKTTVDL